MKTKKILSLVSVFSLILFGSCQKEKTVNEEIETRSEERRVGKECA